MNRFRRLRERLRWLIWEAKYESAEGIVALRSLQWGGWLLLPWDTFKSADATYHAFNGLGPEWLWGALVFLAGAFQMAALLNGGVHLRARAGVFTTLAWIVVATVYAWSNWHTAAVPTHAFTAIVAGWVCTRLWMDD